MKNKHAKFHWATTILRYKKVGKTEIIGNIIYIYYIGIPTSKNDTFWQVIKTVVNGILTSGFFLSPKNLKKAKKQEKIEISKNRLFCS